MKAYERPEPTIPRVEGGHRRDWLDAIREGRSAGSHFGYGGTMSETALLGVIAMRFPGVELKYNAKRGRFTNCKPANALLNPPYRKGWTL